MSAVEGAAGGFISLPTVLIMKLVDFEAILATADHVVIEFVP